MWAIINVDKGGVELLTSTKKEAKELAKSWRWLDKWAGLNYKYVIEKEENI